MRLLAIALLVAAAAVPARAGDPPACDGATTVGAALVAAWRAEVATRALPVAQTKPAPRKSFAELVESRERSSKKAPPGENADGAACTK